MLFILWFICLFFCCCVVLLLLFKFLEEFFCCEDGVYCPLPTFPWGIKFFSYLMSFFFFFYMIWVNYCIFSLLRVSSASVACAVSLVYFCVACLLKYIFVYVDIFRCSCTCEFYLCMSSVKEGNMWVIFSLDRYIINDSWVFFLLGGQCFILQKLLDG